MTRQDFIDNLEWNWSNFKRECREEELKIKEMKEDIRREYQIKHDLSIADYIIEMVNK